MALESNSSRDQSKVVKEEFFDEVEDIMLDQRIISDDLQVIAFENERSSLIFLSTRRLRLVMALLTRNLMPTLLKMFYMYLRNQQLMVDQLRHRLLPSILAFIVNNLSSSLASVQKRITYPLKKSLKYNLRNDPEDDDISTQPERSVDCQVLSAPDKYEDIAAEVIFIHGLHGGIDRTWKQGQWRHNGHKLLNSKPVRRKSTGHLVVPVRKYKKSATDRSVTKDSGENDVCFIGDDEWVVVNDFPEEEDGFSDCWPRDWLPKDCPGVRVIALNYTTDVLWCPVWKKKRARTGIIERSDEMIEELLRLGVGKKPIIWVGHSKGGLFIKQIILNAWERHRHRNDIYDIFQNSKGIMFYSVPHKGSVLADVTLPLLRRSVELIEIQRNCEFVLDMHRRFVEICEQGHLGAEIFSFIETSFTLMSFIYLKIVAYDSADPAVGVKCDVPLDHRQICKPAGRDCFLYLELVNLIKKYISDHNMST